MSKLIIEYDPINGQCIPDGKIKEWIEDKVSLSSELKSELIVITSSSLVIEEVRALIGEHVLSNKNIAFKFKGEMLYPDRSGMLDYWPKGFCDIFENILEKLM